jgi:hypothetical protein
VASSGSHAAKPTVLGAATACGAGLVAITPACAFVTPSARSGSAFGASLICYAAVTLLKAEAGYDDSLDVFGVHGFGRHLGRDRAPACSIAPVRAARRRRRGCDRWAASSRASRSRPSTRRS